MYCKPPFAGLEHVLAYVGRYIHRVVISNDRLVALADGRVRFRWRDYADGDRVDNRSPVCQQGQLRRLDRLPPAPAAWDTS